MSDSGLQFMINIEIKNNAEGHLEMMIRTLFSTSTLNEVSLLLTIHLFQIEKIHSFSIWFHGKVVSAVMAFLDS